MNTSRYIPNESIFPIVIKSDDCPEFPFFSGTGFFVKFNPFKSIYFITAKHCTLDSNNQPKGSVIVKLNTNPSCNKVIPFNFHIFGQLVDDDSPEDVAIYEVGELPEEDKKTLEHLALALPNQEEAEFILTKISQEKQKVRILGYPSVSKEIDYENNSAKIQARGIVGRVTHTTPNMRWFTVEELNWKDGGIDGFSGSPVFALIPNIFGNVKAIPIGILSTGRDNLFKFISINVATDIIAHHLSNLSTNTTFK